MYEKYHFLYKFKLNLFQKPQIGEKMGRDNKVENFKVDTIVGH